MAVERGPHHCVGLASAVSEMIFRFLQSRCTAAGGSLSEADLDAARAHFIASYPNAAGFFVTANQRCMEANTGDPVFERETILPTLLMACSHKAARSAFAHQVERCGEPWLMQFYGGIAEFLRKTIPNDPDARLMRHYIDIACKCGARLQVENLLSEDPVRRVLLECVKPLVAPDAPDALATPLSDSVSLHIAAVRGIPKPDISKVTDLEMRNFLIWAPPQLNLSIMTPPRRAAAPSAAVA